jgi:ankyrin repeat protein
MPKSVRSLDRITVAQPCNADWDSMAGNDQVRFCEHCNLHVHDLSSMSRLRAMNLVRRSEGRLCVRYVQRSDGRLLTKQIPEKLHRIGRKVSRIAAGAFTASLSLSSASAQNPSQSSSPNVAAKSATEVLDEVRLGATVLGTITDQDNKPIAAANLTLISQETQAALVNLADKDGKYHFSFLKEGKYQLTVQARGYRDVEGREIKVESNLNTVIDIALQPQPTIEQQLIELTDSVNNETAIVRPDRTRFVTMGVMASRAPTDPLVMAIVAEDEEKVRELAAVALNLDADDPETGTNALQHAVETGNLKIVQILLAAGASVKARNGAGETVLMRLSESATPELVRELISSGAKVNAHDNSGNTPLMNAVSNAKLAVVKELIEAGARINVKNGEDKTALMFAAANDNDPSIAKLLIEAGSEINVKDHDGETPLMMAAKDGSVETIKALIDAGAETNARNNDNKTALMMAADEGPSDNVKALIKAEADINLKDKDGQTALMFAASSNDQESVNALLDAGADINATNRDGKSAIDLARDADHQDVVKLLRSRGARE